MTAPLTSLALQILDYVPADGTAARLWWIAEQSGQPKGLVREILLELRKDGIVRGGPQGWWRRA